MGKQELENLANLGHLKRSRARVPNLTAWSLPPKNSWPTLKRKNLLPRADLIWPTGPLMASRSLPCGRTDTARKNRYMVFQALTHTVGLTNEVMRVFSKCHDVRNLAEYEGHTEVDERFSRNLFVTRPILSNPCSPLNRRLNRTNGDAIADTSAKATFTGSQEDRRCSEVEFLRH